MTNEKVSNRRTLLKSIAASAAAISTVQLLTQDKVTAQNAGWESEGNNVVLSGGNVGINTQFPGQALDVVGNIRVNEGNSIGWWNRDFQGGGTAFYNARIAKGPGNYAGNLQFYTRYGGDNVEALVMELSWHSAIA